MKLQNILVSVLVLLVLVLGAVFLIRRQSGQEEVARQNIDMLKEEQGEVESVPEEGVKTEEVQYGQGATGFLAWPAAKGNYPGVVMIHEWWGLNEEIKEAAKLLAEEGYTVLAVDLYKGEVAENADRARELVTALDQEAATANLRAATTYLRNQAGAEKIASWGWCFGGGQSLQLALSGEPLDATVIYYGSLVDDRLQLKQINGPVLGIFGDQDSSIPVSSVEVFEAGLISAEVPHQIEIYKGVGHAFANPSGANYAPKETMDAWEKTLDFLRTNLK